MIKTVSNKTTARIAGLLYLMVVLTGIFSLMYVPNKLIVWNNASMTFHNITASETLFRFGILSGLACFTFFLFLSLVLYKLLKPVNENYAKLMVIFVFLSIPIFFINVQNQLTVLSLVNDTNSLNLFSAEQIQSQVLFYLDQYDSGMSIVHIFSGLWLFPLGYLVFKSGFLPKILGILLILGCFGYLINFIGSTLFKNYSEFGISKFVSLPASIGEIGTCLWLLLIGVKVNVNTGKQNGKK
ncbi:MAG: DUF4386 domain-containing protein [Aquaticitalea sp.]